MEAAGEIREDLYSQDSPAGFGETGIGYWQNGIQTLRAEGENRPSRPSNLVVWPEITGSLVARADGSPCVDRGQPFVAGFIGKASPSAGSIGYHENLAPTLKAEQQMHVVYACRTDQTGANGLGINIDVAQTIDGANGQAVVYDARGNGDGRLCPTITGDHQNRVTDYTALAIDCRNGTLNEELSATLQAHPGGGYSLNCQNPVITFGFQSFGHYTETDKSKSLMACDDITTGDLICSGYTVRRLTPMECERLMGYPDGWTEYSVDGKETSDTQRYKACGNSVAIPCVEYIMRGIAETERGRT
jgi:DNA (cytosine-5)-methyltransferase 1